MENHIYVDCDVPGTFDGSRRTVEHLMPLDVFGGDSDGFNYRQPHEQKHNKTDTRLNFWRRWKAKICL